MDILFNYISALLWGILIGLILSGFVMYIAHKICGISYLISGLIGAFLLFFMTFQFTALIGANKTKKYVENVVTSAQAVGENIDWTIVKDKYSLLKSYLGEVEMSSENVMNIKTMITDSIDRYIWRRFGWIVGGILVAFGVMIGGGAMEANRVSNHRRRTSGTHRNNRGHRTRR
jgi:hypothetical protein